MKSHKNVLLALFTFALVLLASPVFAVTGINGGKAVGAELSAVSKDSYTARTTANLNLRSSMSTKNKSNVILVIPKDSVVTVRSHEENNWYQVIYNGKTGYVKGGLITENTDTMKTTAALRLRTEMNTKNKKNIILVMPKGSMVDVIARYKNKWALVNYKGKNGYCSSSYLIKAESNKIPVKVTTTNLRMRSSMNSKSKKNVILVIPKGNKVEVISEQDGGWMKVKYGKKTGYVMSKYLRNGNENASSTGEVKTMTANVNIRSSKSTASKKNIITTAKKGKVITIISAEGGGWYKVKYGNKEGYMKSKRWK